MGHSIVWVDIPVTDLDRAIRFYSAVLGRPVHKFDGPDGSAIGVFDHNKDELAGCLVVNTAGSNTPDQNGPLLYLNAEGRLDEAIAAVHENGGSIGQDIHQIGQHGFRAIIFDTEGNRLALHSMTR